MLSDVDEVLSTTRAVRRRLDLTRPVKRELLMQCVELAMQAPTERNWQRWEFLFVDDERKRKLLADLYRRGIGDVADAVPPEYGIDRSGGCSADRIGSSAGYLHNHIHEVPVLLIPCVRVSRHGTGAHVDQANMWASVMPAVWSFMLAARSRGLGTVFTTPHLRREEEASEVLGIPFPKIRQVGLIPVGHVLGERFRAIRTAGAGSASRWNSWTPSDCAD